MNLSYKLENGKPENEDKEAVIVCWSWAGAQGSNITVMINFAECNVKVSHRSVKCVNIIFYLLYDSILNISSTPQ